MTENVEKVSELSEKDLMDPAQSSVLSFELPAGVLGEDGEVHTTAIVKEMTGYEEDILASPRMKVHEKIQLILERCTERIGSYHQGMGNWSKIVKSLPVADRSLLCIKIREASLGNMYAFAVECPHCKHRSTQQLDLDSLVIQGIKNKKERVWKNTFPKCKKTYTAKIMTGEEEDKIAKIDMSGSDVGSLIFMSRLLEIGGVSPVTLEMVKSLPFIDRSFLRKDIANHEGEIERLIDSGCPKCGNDFQTELDLGGPGFFFPSE